MDFSGKTIKKYIVHILIVIFLILYLVSADTLFETIIPVKDESRSVSFSIPDESSNITYIIDSQNTLNLEWKSAIAITGWAFINDQDVAVTKKYIFFESANSTYVFETLPISRPDVTDAFKNYNRNLTSSGFTANIPIYQINEGRYQIGIILKTNTTTYAIRTNHYYVKPEKDLVETGT
jgi:hypothetical protein